MRSTHWTPGSPASELIDDLARSARPVDPVGQDPLPLVACVVGAGGTGKSSLLHVLETAARSAGIPVGHDTRAPEPLLIIDDAHRLDELAVEALLERVRGGASVVAATRFVQPQPAVRRLVEEFERHRQSIVLGPLSAAGIGELLESASGGFARGPAILHLTGGLPWLVHAVLDELGADPGLADRLLDQAECAPQALINRIAHAITAADEPTRRLLVELATARVSQPGAVAPRPRGDVDDAFDRAIDAGLLLASGDLPPLVRHTVLVTTPLHRLRATAAPSGASFLPMPSSVGDLDTTERLVDDVLLGTDEPSRESLELSAALWASRGMLSFSARTYRAIPGPLGESAPLAAVALIGIGEGEAAHDLMRSNPSEEPPTMRGVAVALMAAGVRESVAEENTGSLSTLVQASDMLSASGSITPLPDSPAALAALVAFHTGEPEIGDAVIDAALLSRQNGDRFAARLLLLRAWSSLHRNHLGAARTAIDEAVARAGQLVPRDDFLRMALEVGLARRADDLAALTTAWKSARQTLLHVPVDLYNLDALGELTVAAARLREPERVTAGLATAWELLRRLGDPPQWSILLHWSQVQAAILLDQPDALRPHAAELVRHAEHSRMSAVLAGAGRAWLAVLSGRVDAAAVEHAARRLASVGLAWDGSRLAGHAAAHVEERRDLARLLACARDLRPQDDGEPAGTISAPAHDETPDDGQLSGRETEVARLLLDGKTYREIGEVMFISPRTVEHHVAHIRRRFAASTRSDLLGQLRSALENPDPPEGGLPETPSTPHAQPHLTTHPSGDRGGSTRMWATGVAP